MALDEPRENEEPVNVNGIDVLAADLAGNDVEGAVVDYIVRPDGEGFTVTGNGCDSCSSC